MSTRLLTLCCIGVLCIAASASAEEKAASTQEQFDFFDSQIRPVLVTHCYECHSSESKIVQGGLRLDSSAGLLKGGDTGSAIVPGKAEMSLLIKALRYDGIEMPPKGRLSA